MENKPYRLAPLFSSASVEWSTPQDFFERKNAEFGPFEIDVCATPENKKCAKYFGPGSHLGEDGLAADWIAHASENPKRFWMNPPYGRAIGAWIKKAFEESQKGCLVVCLLPSRTGTRWFHDHCQKGEIRFLKGRLKFGGSKNSATFDSMLVIFRGKEIF